MVYIRAIIQDQTGLKVDQRDPKGGTSPTGNAARKAFQMNVNILIVREA